MGMIQSGSTMLDETTDEAAVTNSNQVAKTRESMLSRMRSSERSKSFDEQHVGHRTRGDVELSNARCAGSETSESMLRKVMWRPKWRPSKLVTKSTVTRSSSMTSSSSTGGI